jgi:phage tail-like protein
VIYKIPANPTWGNITLKRGVTDAMDLWEWRELVESGKVDEARKNGSIVLYDQERQEVARWNFENAWPSKLTGPSFNAAADDIAIEELEIVVESYKRVKAS